MQTATTTTNYATSIVNSMPLAEWITHFKAMVIRTYENEKGVKWSTCVFITHVGEECKVNFSDKLGELTAAEIKAQMHSLQVVKLSTGTYKLCRMGKHCKVVNEEQCNLWS